MSDHEKEYFNTPEYIAYLKRNCELIDRDTGNRDETFTSPHMDIIIKYTDQLGIEPGRQMLEIGCGLGRLVDYLGKHYGIDISGIDVSDETCKLAMERLSQSSGEIKVGSAEKIPFPDSSFDYVLCWGVFDLTDQGYAIAEMLRVLKVGGKLLLTGKNNEFMPDDEDAQIAEIKSREKNIPNHYTDYNALKQLVESNGANLALEHFFLRRGDFMAGRYVINQPAQFQEYCVIVQKESIELPVINEISDSYSKTWRQKHG
ncbi:MAG: class I SAM-dependent methyltransferase [Proteobacteria bacterium]|nr:class I SAM-dependent methyltransferase [Pseudomonadota bacterium]MBU1688670.1 class I SAM-dependent methyltransferase [Pseudomonadota bacterium]